MKKLAWLLLVAACGGSAQAPHAAPAPGIREVIVVLRGSDHPLPFDPRAGRIAIVAKELRDLLGHGLSLELEAALSPELQSSLEAGVAASFEGLARELVLLRREDKDLFEKARRLERIVCKYDVFAKAMSATLEDEGKTLRVLSPPDRFPLLEPGIASEALLLGHVGDLDARWGAADPAQLSARERGPYFAYVTRSRPGYGYLWMRWRQGQKPSYAGDAHESVRLEHVGKVVRLASVLKPDDPLEARVRAFLVENAAFVGKHGRSSSPPDPTVLREVVGAYEAWLTRAAPRFSDEERVTFARALFAPSEHERATFPSFDAFAFGLAIFDEWAKSGAPLEPQRESHRAIVCPKKRPGEAEIHHGCSPYFARMIQDDPTRARLSEAILKRRDARLLETALLGVGYDDGAHAFALVESLSRDDALFRQGMKVLLEDFARREDVRGALSRAAPGWWRDVPSRRGLALLVMAREHDHLHVHYGDNHWTRFVAEYGGPVQKDVLAAYLAEGPRAIEMTPKIWLALQKGTERDELVARSLPVLLARDREARTSRAQPALMLLRTRLCEERNAAGFATMRSQLERWAREHPDDQASVSNALADFVVARCPKPSDRN